MQVIKIRTNHFVLSRPAEDLGNRSLLDVRETSGFSSLFIYFLFFCVGVCVCKTVALLRIIFWVYLAFL